jgi:MFS family permease
MSDATTVTREHLAADEDGSVWAVPVRYAWLVLALTFGLLLSDYMSRQVLNAVFPLLKVEWQLSDTQLGLLGGAVPLMVGVLAFPLSLVADYVGRIRSIVVMALLWSVATLGCGLAQHYGQMLTARLFVGVGEAAYGSVGIAVVLGVFPRTLRATIVGIFTAGGLFGAVIGMALGGSMAQFMGWRWSFAAMAVFGAVLALLYPTIVQERKVAQATPCNGSAQGHCLVTLDGLQRFVVALFPCRRVVFSYIGSGIQLMISAASVVWLPSYFNRYYGMAPAEASGTAAIFVLIGGVGMIACGALADRAGYRLPARKLTFAAFFCLMTAVFFLFAFSFPPGRAQLVLIGLAMFVSSGSLGPAGAAVADGTDAAIHATAFATLTLANNLLGLAPGPFVMGVLADHLNLLRAFQIVPLVGLLAAAVFLIARYRTAASET